MKHSSKASAVIFWVAFLFKHLEEHKLQFQHPIMLALKATKLHRIFKLMNIQNLSFVIKLIFKEHEKNNGQPVSNTTMSWESKSFFLNNRISLFSNFRTNVKALIMRCFFSNKRSFNPLTTMNFLPRVYFFLLHFPSTRFPPVRPFLPLIWHQLVFTTGASNQVGSTKDHL